MGIYVLLVKQQILSVANTFGNCFIGRNQRKSLLLHLILRTCYPLGELWWHTRYAAVPHFLTYCQYSQGGRLVLHVDIDVLGWRNRNMICWPMAGSGSNFSRTTRSISDQPSMSHFDRWSLYWSRLSLRHISCVGSDVQAHIKNHGINSLQYHGVYANFGSKFTMGQSQGSGCWMRLRLCFWIHIWKSRVLVPLKAASQLSGLARHSWFPIVSMRQPGGVLPTHHMAAMLCYAVSLHGSHFVTSANRALKIKNEPIGQKRLVIPVLNSQLITMLFFRMLMDLSVMEWWQYITCSVHNVYLYAPA